MAMYKKILAFGCSATYGHGLVDCYDPKTRGPGLKPSIYSWPSLLANKLQTDVDNISKCGIGQDSIINKILLSVESTITHIAPPEILVVVLWPYPNRFKFMRTNEINQTLESFIKKYPNVGLDASVFTGDNNPQIANYYKYLHHDYESALSYLRNIRLVTTYLRTLGIKYYQSKVDADRILLQCNDITSLVNFDEFIKIPRYVNNQIRYLYPESYHQAENLSRALDGKHWGPELHQILSEQFFMKIVDEYKK